MLVSGCLLVAMLMLPVSGLFEDQAGKWDWRQRFVGKIDTIVPFHLSSESSALLVTTKKNVLASISVKNGSLHWRQVFEDRKSDPTSFSLDTVSCDDDMFGIEDDPKSGSVAVTISGTGRYIRSWDVRSGLLKDEISIPHELIKSDIRSVKHVD